MRKGENAPRATFSMVDLDLMGFLPILILEAFRAAWVRRSVLVVLVFNARLIAALAAGLRHGFLCVARAPPAPFALRCVSMAQSFSHQPAQRLTNCKATLRLARSCCLWLLLGVVTQCNSNTLRQYVPSQWHGFSDGWGLTARLVFATARSVGDNDTRMLLSVKRHWDVHKDVKPECHNWVRHTACYRA